MRSIIGKSTVKEMHRAIEEASAGMKGARLFILVTSHDRLADAARILAQKYPETPCIGTSGTCFSNGASSEQDVVITAFMEGVQVETGIITKASTCPLLSIGSLKENVRKISPGAEDTVCIEFCTGAEEKMVTTINAGFGSKKIGLIGGTVFGYPQGVQPKVSWNGAVYEDACTYALIKNTSGRVRVYKENIYAKNSDIFHIATKVNRQKKELIQLDGRPAVDVYAQELQIPKNKVIDNVFKNPMGRVVGNQIFISSMKEFGTNGSLINFKQINENDTIYFLKRLDVDEVTAQTRQQIKGEMKQISLVFSVDCIYRYLLFNMENYLPTYLQNMKTLGPHCGIVGGGEQYQNQHVNQTMVCVVFE